MRTDLYDTVTAKIIKDMESGLLPWVQPWSNGASGTLPLNATTRRNYSGVNVLLLWGTSQVAGYQSQEWLTYNQAQSVGAQVRKGERGTTIYFADKFVPKTEKAKPVEDQRSLYFLKAFSVFNVAQCDGIEPAARVPMTERQSIDRAEALIANTGAQVDIGGDKAFYRPAVDRIQLPPQQAFAPNQINYYRTAFHEIGHWTGHASRLDRAYGKRFGDSAYAREELVAEMASAFVCASLDIVPTVRHADYIGSWLEVLKTDNKAIFTAASHASKAADFILSRAQVAQQQAA